jgi:hypothetical protein
MHLAPIAAQSQPTLQLPMGPTIYQPAQVSLKSLLPMLSDDRGDAANQLRPELRPEPQIACLGPSFG